METKELLLENIKEFLKQGRSALDSKAFNSAVTLYFKALAVLSDFYILKDDGFIPKNHTERFRIIKTKNPEIYKILNKDFPIYQQSYRIKLDKEYVEVLRHDIKRIVEILQLKI